MGIYPQEYSVKKKEWEHSQLILQILHTQKINPFLFPCNLKKDPLFTLYLFAIPLILPL